MSENDRVIVVGAGIAGISAAKKLQEEGKKVVVLEARERAGGRIHSIELGDDRVDMGASWMNGEEGNPIAEEAKELNIGYERFPVVTPESAYDGVTAKSFPGDVIDCYNDDFHEELEQLKEELGPDASMSDASDAFIARKGLTGDEARIARWAIEQFDVEAFYGGPTNETSLEWFYEDDGFDGNDFGFPDGYGQLIEAMAQGIDIRLNQPVTQISHYSEGVVVQAGEIFQGERVIITVPLGVLKNKQIEFDPVLPQPKLEAIQKLAMGTLEKVVLQFDSVFWPAAGLSYIDEPQGRLPCYMDISAMNKKPTLVVFHGGSQSVELLSKHDDESIKQMIMERLSYATQQTVPEPIHYKVSRWSSEIYSYGSNVFIPLGASINDIKELAKPVGRLYFAGEATTSRYYGTTHGAMITGYREAENVLLETC